MPSWAQCCRTAAWYVFDYETPKLVTIRSLKVGLANRLVQAAVIAYIVGFVIVYKKGYQDEDVGESAVTTKLKGVSSSLNRTDLPEHYRRLWDPADYHIPPQENNAFFVLTNAILSSPQRQGVCAEDSLIPAAHCNATVQSCEEGRVLGNGIQTGECNETTATCDIRTWCPVQRDALQPPLQTTPLIDAENFTVLVKNFVIFPKFAQKRRNIVGKVNNHSYLAKPCLYHPVTDPLCPIFRIADILRYSNADYHSLAITGGVIGMLIRWDCNLDWSIDDCLPEYEFRRLDNPNVTVSKGWNFRTANQYMVDGVAERTLIKAYGILFVVSVHGKAGKFSVVPLLLNVGSGLALLTLATVIGDVVLLYLHGKRRYFADQKYLKLIDDDFARLTSRSDREPIVEEGAEDNQS